MHDIDRTQSEFDAALNEYQGEQYEYPGESGEDEFGMRESYETYPETESYETYEDEVHESGLSEAEEMEMASELLEVTSEEELEFFLDKLIRGAASKLGRAVRSPLGRALTDVLRPLAKAALPIAGPAVGTFLGGPLGGAAGGKLASAAGQLFGLELEGLSGEDRDFEIARRTVRHAAATTGNAVLADPSADPVSVAKGAASAAARQIMPGLVSQTAAMPGVTSLPPAIARPHSGHGGHKQRGTWVRRGRRIILLGI